MKVGVSEKAARAYLALLSFGEATISQIGKKAKIPRTSLYYTINELKERNMIREIKKDKKMLFAFVEPDKFIETLKEGVIDLEGARFDLNEFKYSSFHKPCIDFYYGSSGFRDAWVKIVTGDYKEYVHISDPKFFDEFVQEKYIFDKIIKEKLKRNIKSKQLLVCNDYSKYVQKRDNRENRETRFLPKNVTISFIEVITPFSVFFFSHKDKNFSFEIRDPEFAQTKRNLFDILWQNSFSDLD